jgi:hypothetical protein
MPHEGSDVLNLPAPGAMAFYFMCEFDGRQKLIRHFHGLKLAGRQGDQLFAQALQGPVFIFFPGSALIFRIHFAGLLLDASNLEPPRLLQRQGCFYTPTLALFNLVRQRQGPFRRITANTAKGL